MCWVILVLGYVAAYVIWYRNKPVAGAANGLYFVYFDSGAFSAYERPVYYFFWPVYRLRCALGGQRHNLDRPPPVDVDGF